MYVFPERNGKGLGWWAMCEERHFLFPVSRLCWGLCFIPIGVAASVLMYRHLELPLLPSLSCSWGFPGGSNGKESACNAGNLGLIPGLGRSPGEGHGNLLQYSCLENPTDRGAWWAPWGYKGSDMTEQITLSLFSIALSSNGTQGRPWAWGFWTVNTNTNT